MVGEAKNGLEAIKLTEELRPDLVLLDIRMPGMDGLETARHFLSLDEPPGVIFCTAYEEHAIQAFELQAVGYLLKPVRREQLSQALAQSVRLNRAQIAALKTEDAEARSHISARTHRGIELVPVEDVLYFQADQKYVTVRHLSGELIVDETLRDLEEEFASRFLRVHRNALVAKAHIEALDKAADGQVTVRMKGLSDGVEVSRRHLSQLRKVLKKL